MKRGLALVGIVGCLAGITWLLALPALDGRPGSTVEGLTGNLGSRATAPVVVINEVAWGGTAANFNHEWIELYNNSGAAVDLNGWTLLSSTDGSPTIPLTGTIPAHGYYLLERSSDCAVSDIPADQPPYTGGLNNTGERLELRDGSGTVVDSADGTGGWPAGSGLPDYYSMERVDPTMPDSRANWAGNDGVTRNGLDCNGQPLNGTPKARNSAFVPPSADLGVDKRGPATVRAADLLTYTVVLSNAGRLPAGAVWLTDLLPAQVEFVTHTAPYPFSRPAPGTLVWELGTVPTTTATTPITFTITGLVDGGAWGELRNTITATTATTDANPANNHDAVVTVVGSGPVTPVILIEALYYDSYEANEPDEAVRVMNVSTVTAHLDGWKLNDGSSSHATFPPGTTLAPGQAVWCTKAAVSFERQFGFKPHFETDDTDPTVPNMDGTWPGFANDGDECLLKNGAGEIVDTLVYEEGNTATTGWSGPAVQPWTSGNSFAAEGQILYRKRDQATGLPVPDTDTAADWAQDPADQINGRKVLYPGWDLDPFFFTTRVTETAALTVAVAPDNLYDALVTALSGAQKSIQIESYTFRSLELTNVLLDRLAHGVSVSLLLEGAPAFEGITNQEQWIARALHNGGAQVLFMVNDSINRIHDRYSNQHAKFIVVDGRIALIGSENLNETSLPADDKSDGTAGRRGVWLMTNAPGVVAHIQAILAADADPAHHLDVMSCEQVPDLCSPPSGFVPAPTPNWMTYTVQFPTPFSISGTFAFEVIQSPENSLRDRDSLLGLLGHAGPGDTLLVEQFYEYNHWGPTTGTPETDPNPRLEAYLDAARRGATVRILLDSHFDSDGKNATTRTYLLDAAHSEGLDLQVRLADPTFLGLHNKMVLAHIGGQGYVHVGSINGSEASSKVNRELALQVQSDAAYNYLKAVFDADWQAATPSVYLPMVVRGYQPSLPAAHLLISEVYYSTIPEKEWVEIYNPTPYAVDLSAYKVGDAANPDNYEGMYRFPPGTSLAPGGVLVVAVTANGFRQDFPGKSPDLELLETDPAVPNLIKSATWGRGDWGLSNSGDEVLLLDGNDQAVDVVVYGDGLYPGVVPHPGVSTYGHSLERYPPQFDTDDCSADFRDWPYPHPGELP